MKPTNKMKLLFIVLTFFTLNSSLFSQTQSLTVVKMKNGSAIIECKKISQGYSIFNRDNTSTTESDVGNYCITAQTNILLQTGLKKVVNWAKLNLEHKQSFDKEVMRFRITEKRIYEFYRYFIPEFSNEAILSFTGFSQGNFNMTINIATDVVSIDLISIDDVENFIKMLQGKSVNKEIDDVFH